MIKNEVYSKKKNSQKYTKLQFKVEFFNQIIFNTVLFL